MSEEVIVPTATPARSVRAVRPRPDVQTPPAVEARGVRRWLHVAVATGGWALFSYWWWIVLQRTSRAQVESSAVFLGVALVAVVATTGFWILHNRALFRRKGPRTQVLPEAPVPTEDALGQPLVYEGGPDAVRATGHVRIVVEDAGKRYKAARG